MKYIEKKCENCDNIIKIKIVEQGKNKDEIYAVDKNRKFCCVSCQNEWQRKISWEDRVGEESALKIRKDTSDRVKGDKNPTHNPEIAKKVSDSLKIYLKDNPRLGEKNPFYGKKHTDEYKLWAIESRKGIRSCNEEQSQKQLENSVRGINHHRWNGGTSFGEYSHDFNKHLKKTIKNRDEHSCCICSKKTQKLAVHHIDYDKMNSDEKNLVSLCYSCHSKTNINRDNWKLFLEKIISDKYDKMSEILLKNELVQILINVKQK